MEATDMKTTKHALCQVTYTTIPKGLMGLSSMTRLSKPPLPLLLPTNGQERGFTFHHGSSILCSGLKGGGAGFFCLFLGSISLRMQQHTQSLLLILSVVVTGHR